MTDPRRTADLDAYLVAHDARFKAELCDFLRIPSVSARPEHAGDVRRAAEWLAATLRRIGLRAELLETAGHPAVLGEWREAGPDAPTLLVYGHYDVQPVEPIEQWSSPPFEPTMRDGRLYARGATDDKGQLFVHLAALAAHLETRGTLPVNIVLLAEGEEEVGSPSLPALLDRLGDRLRVDAALISDSPMFAPGIPALGTSARGHCAVQIDVSGPASDLHSGEFGGSVANPATALARLIATLHDDQGRVAIPGFYDTVRELPEAVRAAVRAVPLDDETLRRQAGAPALVGEAGYTPLERLWLRPACDVTGMTAGYTGVGLKTVLPARATAKVSFRLVSDQDPGTVQRLACAHLESIAPPGLSVQVAPLGGVATPWRARMDGAIAGAARRALEHVFGHEPVIVGSGGSLPVLAELERRLDAPVLLLGFGLPGENAHAPDEWLSLDNFERGARTVALLLDEIGRDHRARAATVAGESQAGA